MKLISSFLFATTVTAAPTIAKAATRRNSSELGPIPGLTATTTTTTLDVDLVDVAAKDLHSGESDSDKNVRFLNGLSDEDWETIFDSLTSVMEERLGVEADVLEKLSDEEFDSLLKAM